LLDLHAAIIEPRAGAAIVAYTDPHAAKYGATAAAPWGTTQARTAFHRLQPHAGRRTSWVMEPTESTRVGIDTRRRYELQRLMDDVLRAGRTVRSETRLERTGRCRELVGSVQGQLEPHGVNDEPGLKAVQVWLQALRETDPGDVDRLQELLYGLDALVRTHIWRETGFPLEPPPATALGF
jgi:hypothetical protein